jgi:protein-S-isoprenylcysteine O-methyltransferase Ste14
MSSNGPSSGRRPLLQRGIRPSKTRAVGALWAKSLLNAVLFFGIFMVLLPWGAHRLLPVTIPLPVALSTGGGGILFFAGIAVWLWGLDVFSRRGRGTPFPLDAPRNLATKGPFEWVRNPIMAAELAVIWAVALYTASAGIGIYAMLVTVAARLVVVRIEEPELRDRFGETYRAYCRKVPRWLPWTRPREVR